MRTLRFTAITIAVLGCGLLASNNAKANSIIPNPPLVTGASPGIFNYSYDVRLDNSSIVDNTRGSIVLSNIAGYQAGSLTFSSQFGANNFDQTVVTAGGLTTLTFTYDNKTNPNAFVQGPHDGANGTGYLFTFGFNDVYGERFTIKNGKQVPVTTVNYASQDMDKDFNDQHNDGTVAGPSAIPEPAFIQLGSLLALGGVGGVFQMRRARRKA